MTPTVLLLAIIAYLLWKQGGGSVSVSGQVGDGSASVSFSAFGPNSDPRYWYEGIQPGTVTLGGQPAPTGWNPGQDMSKKTLSLAGTGISTAEGLASGIAGIQGSSSILAASTTLGAVTLGVGLAVGVASMIVGMISAHHQQALAAEGKALNDADPRMVNAMVLVVQGVLAGAITSAAAAQSQLNQIVSDWYGEVKGIQRGTWHYNLTPQQDPSILTDDPTPGTENWFGATISNNRRPDPCNAACTVGHYVTERNAAIAMIAVNNILAGKHGVMTFPEIGPHDTQSGFPQVRLVY